MNTPTLCDYCQHPAEGLRCRLLHGDPKSKLVALDHPACYVVFMADLVLMSGGVPGAYPAAGYCHKCKTWTPRGRVVAEIHTDAGAGGIVVRCLACCQPPPAGPLTAPLHAYDLADLAV